MGQTKIEWATDSWNPVTGCTKISPGCQNCYAERMSKRLAGRCGYPKDEPFRVTLHPERLDEPMHWRKPRRIFVCSMGDLFHEDVPGEFIGQAFNAMCNAQWFHGHIFLVLTKRPERMLGVIKAIEQGIMEQRKPIKLDNGFTRHQMTFHFPLQNIWLGVTAENQEQADKRIPILLQIPAAVRFVSVESMLGPVDLTKEYLSYTCGDYPFPHLASEHRTRLIDLLDWVICGGETGPGAREMKSSWAVALKDQCVAAGVPFFFKKFGDFTKKRLHIPGHPWEYERLLDGRTWDEYPEVR